MARQKPGEFPAQPGEYAERGPRGGEVAHPNQVTMDSVETPLPPTQEPGHTWQWVGSAEGTPTEGAESTPSSDVTGDRKTTPETGGEEDRPPSRPTLVDSRQRNSSAWWWWIVVIAIVLVAGVAAWYFLLREDGQTVPVTSPSPSPLAWTGSWERVDGVGGGLVVAGSEGAYEVTLYDSALRSAEAVPATLTEEGRALEFRLPPQFTFSGPSGPFEAKLVGGAEAGKATLRVSGADGTVTLLALHRVPQLMPPGSLSASPAASPSPAPALTPSP